MKHEDYLREWTGDTTENITEEITENITEEITEEIADDTLKVVALTRDIWGNIDHVYYIHCTPVDLVGAVVYEINHAKARLQDRGARVYYSPELDCIAVVSESLNSAIQGVQPLWDYIEAWGFAHRKECESDAEE